MNNPECPRPNDCICPWARRGVDSRTGIFIEPWQHMKVVHGCPIHDPEKKVRYDYYDFHESPGR